MTIFHPRCRGNKCKKENKTKTPIDWKPQEIRPSVRVAASAGARGLFYFGVKPKHFRLPVSCLRYCRPFTFSLSGNPGLANSVVAADAAESWPADRPAGRCCHRCARRAPPRLWPPSRSQGRPRIPETPLAVGQGDRPHLPPKPSHAALPAAAGGRRRRPGHQAAVPARRVVPRAAHLGRP